MGKANRILADMLRNEIGVETPSSSVLSDIFAEEPPTLTDFVGDKKFMYNPPLSEIQYGFVRHFEQILYPETYILMVEEFGEYWAPVRFVNELVAAWGKGSSAPYTPVYNAETGQWQRLDEFREGLVAAAYPKQGKVDVYEGSDAFLEGHGRMFRVTTTSGLVEDVWEGHRYLARPTKRLPNGKPYYQNTNPGIPTKRGFMKASVEPQWQRLWDLKVGDQIATATTLPEPTSPVGIDPSVIELLALFIGDGCCPVGDGQASVCGGAAAVVTRARLIDIYSGFGWDFREEVRADGKWSLYPKNFNPHRGKPSPFRSLLKSYKLDTSGAYTKRVPPEIFSLDNKGIALFMSRLIDTDGWASVSNTVEIGYATVSEGLASDVRRLLLRLGVPSRVNKKRTAWTHNGEKKSGFSYTVRVRHPGDVLKLGGQLSLLDKQPNLDHVMQEAQKCSPKRHRHGDLLWDEIKSIEFIGEGDYWTLSVDGPACYISSGGLLSHNSGKDHCSQLSFARTANILLSMKDPQGYFGLSHQTIIHMLNVAVSAPQAHGVFFKPLRTLITSSQWFSDKFEGEPPGPQAQSIRFAKQIELISGHSEAESLEGKNLICAIADEISAFPTIAESEASRSGRAPSKTADGILEMLRSSATTRFPLTFKMGQISYSRSKGDAILQALAEAKDDIAEFGDESRYYASGPHRTWDVNPRYKDIPFITVPGASAPIPNVPSIVKDYRKKPAYARGKYECDPETSTNRYFKDDTAIHAAFSTRRPIPPVLIDYFVGIDVEEQGTVPQWQVKFIFDPEFVPVTGALYAVHGDMAINGDRAGLAMAHVTHWEENMSGGEDGEDYEERRPFVKVDVATYFESDEAAWDETRDQVLAREIQIRWFRKWVMALVDRGFPIVSVSLDGFQSADSLQILQARGMEATKQSTDSDLTPWKTLRDVMYEGRLEGYWEPILVEELRGLTQLPNGKVDHPALGSKDIADAVACAVLGAVKIGGEEEDEVLFANGDETGLWSAQLFGESTWEMPDAMSGWVTSSFSKEGSW